MACPFNKKCHFGDISIAVCIDLKPSFTTFSAASDEQQKQDISIAMFFNKKIRVIYKEFMWLMLCYDRYNFKHLRGSLKSLL